MALHSKACTSLLQQIVFNEKSGLDNNKSGQENVTLSVSSLT